MLPYGLQEARTRLLLIRHCQAGDQGLKRYIGQTDTRLTDQGLVQARSLAKFLSSVPLERIVCSDLARSRQTARILGAEHGLREEAIGELREISLGSWEGLPMAQVRDNNPRAFEGRGHDLAGYRPPGGESFADLQSRVVPVMEDVLARAFGPVAVVGHAGVNRVTLCHWLGIPLHRMFTLGQNPGGVSIVQPRHPDGVQVVAWNIVVHGTSTL